MKVINPVWPVEKARQWYEKKGWILGFNYLPSTAVNSTEMWQRASFDMPTIERELRAASASGYNSCRVFLPYLVWEHENPSFLSNFEYFVRCACRNALTVLPVFFDDCAFAGKEPYLGPQDPPVPGVHNSGWTGSPGFDIADHLADKEPLLKAYVWSLLFRYRKDPRIVAWDLYNEPGNSGREDKCLPLLRRAFEWARECDATQPLTVGVYLWKDFDLSVIPLSDIISFHDYGPLETTEERIAMLKQYNRPLVCTEWLHRPAGNTIETHLPLYKRENIGAYNWGLVNGKTQTHLSWDREKNQNGGPTVWQHDIFTGDLAPYNEQEVALIKTLSGKFEQA